MIRQEQCDKVCRILDDVLANRPTERDSLIVAVQKAFEALEGSKWVLCSERLPENGRQVLVFARSVHFALAKYDEMREADGTYKMQWVTFDAWKPFYKIKDVIAWMPLPEPYREGEQK
jgi:hypothetical protein